MCFVVHVKNHVIYQSISHGQTHIYHFYVFFWILFSVIVSNSQLFLEAQIRPRSDFDTQCKLSQFALRFCGATTWDFSIFFSLKSVFAQILSFKKFHLEKVIVFLPLSHSVNWFSKSTAKCSVLSYDKFNDFELEFMTN